MEHRRPFRFYSFRGGKERRLLVGVISKSLDGEWFSVEKPDGTVTFKRPKWKIFVAGNVVHVFREDLPPPPWISKKRGAIGPWSSTSRMKMLRYTNQIDYKRISHSLFITLTWPDERLSCEYGDRTNMRNAFVQKVERFVGKHVPAVWRIEWEERKSGEYTGQLAPHLHLMMFGVRWLAWQRIRRWWRECIDWHGESLSTTVKRIYNEDGACRYLSKYVSKYRSLDVSAYLNSGIKFGRHWGIHRKEGIPMRPVEYEITLAKQSVGHVLDYCEARWPSYVRSSPHGFTLLGEGHVKLFKKWLEKACEHIHVPIEW